MPALPSPGKVIKVTYNMVVGTDSFAMVRTFYSYTGTPPTATQANALATSISSAWATNLAPLMDGTRSLSSVQTNDLGSATGAVGIDATLRPGTRSGTPLPAEVCAIINYGVVRKYRGGHPRSYWPFGVAADLQNPQTWTAAAVTAFTNGVANQDLAVEAAVWSGGGTLDQVNVSFYAGFTVVTNPVTGRARNVPRVRSGVPPLTLPIVDVISEASTNSKVGSQRRRSLHSR